MTIWSTNNEDKAPTIYPVAHPLRDDSILYEDVAIYGYLLQEDGKRLLLEDTDQSQSQGDNNKTTVQWS